MIPQLKNIPRIRRDGEIIFQPDIGVELQVPDPEGQVQALIDLLDGRSGLEKVHACMRRRWPELSLEEVGAGVEGWRGGGPSVLWLCGDDARQTVWRDRV